MISPLPENPGHIRFLCARLHLGTAQREPQRVFGGLHHRMWRLDSDRGTYAIKQLNSDADLDGVAGDNFFNLSEGVAEHFAAHGIAAIYALRNADGYLQVIDNVGYLVYPWTNAVALHREDIREQHALKVAHVLARMHRADISIPRLRDIDQQIHEEEKIAYLVQRANECNVRYATTLKKQLPALLGMVRAQRRATDLLRGHRVISHGDLDHKNVLWHSSDDPVIIDWESVRRVNPTYELLLEALDWSGITMDFQPELFGKMLSSYTGAGGLIDRAAIEASFDCILGDWVNWLMFNVGRASNLEDIEERALGADQLDLALSTLLRLQRLMPKLQSMARAGLSDLPH